MTVKAIPPEPRKHPRQLEAERRDAETKRAELSRARRAAAVHVREWYARRQMRPGYLDSTSPNTRGEFETLIADLEDG